tara:strand:- start:447 stop:677 length:231 start_codon:yes stop_codon:yes gene_type:complete
MKILKFLPLLLILTLYNTGSFAGDTDCDNIKMDSSVNIVKKLKCKAGGSISSTSEKTEDDGGWKLWKKPEWMKKKN